MGIIEEVLHIFNWLVRDNWTRLKSNDIPYWLLQRARRNYKKRRYAYGKSYYVVGKTYFYKVWYRSGRRDWVFYKKKK